MKPRQPDHPSPRQHWRAAEHVYALMLLMYPRAHRRAFGPLMLQTFRDSYRDTLITQGRVGPGFWLGVAGDEAMSLVREHGSALRAKAVRIRRWGFDLTTGAFLLGSVIIYLARCIHG
jgi:hypothetical protein